MIPRSIAEKWAKSQKITKFGTLTPCKFFWRAPKILKPVLDTPFRGLSPGKVETMPPDPKGWEKISPPPIFGGGVPHGGT